MPVSSNEVEHLPLRPKKRAETHREDGSALKNPRNHLPVFHNRTCRKGETSFNAACEHRVFLAMKREDRAAVNASDGGQRVLTELTEQTICVYGHGFYPEAVSGACPPWNRPGLAGGLHLFSFFR
jgi:hypothetical protein